MSTPPNVLPCPFCGAEPFVREEADRFCVCCSSVHCFCALGEGYDRDAMPEHSFASEENAIIAWNTRHAPAVRDEDAVRELREALSDLLPFVLDDYFPDCATPPFREVVERCKALVGIGDPKYFAIIGGYTNKVIGLCHKDAQNQVLSEEPRATFFPITKEQFETQDYEAIAKARALLAEGREMEGEGR